MFLNFRELDEIIDDRDIDFIRVHKDEIEAWSYFSVWFEFTLEELREFNDYIDWPMLFETPHQIRRHTEKELKEFKHFIPYQVEEYIRQVEELDNAGFI